MMNFWDIAGIVFACTAANHLGLIKAIEGIIRKEIPVVNCPKCASFWAALIYLLMGTKGNLLEIPFVLAISFLCAWSAIWLDLFMGIIDHFYLKVYEQIYPTTDETNTDALSATDTVSDVPGGEGSDSIAANYRENNH